MELNEKLARWAGFEFLKGYYYGFDCWRDPEGLVLWFRDYPPNFTSSLDACFKWIHPELMKKGIMWSMHSTYPDGRIWVESWYADSEVVKEREKIGLPTRSNCVHKEGASAWCKAIEQLIDKEGSDERH